MWEGWGCRISIVWWHGQWCAESGLSCRRWWYMSPSRGLIPCCHRNHIGKRSVNSPGSSVLAQSAEG